MRRRFLSALATFAPSGDQATDRVSGSVRSPPIVRSRAPVRFQIRTRRSPPTLATFVPSGDQATSFTRFSWEVFVSTGKPPGETYAPEVFPPVHLDRVNDVERAQADPRRVREPCPVRIAGQEVRPQGLRVVRNRPADVGRGRVRDHRLGALQVEVPEIHAVVDHRHMDARTAKPEGPGVVEVMARNGIRQEGPWTDSRSEQTWILGRWILGSGQLPPRLCAATLDSARRPNRPQIGRKRSGQITLAPFRAVGGGARSNRGGNEKSHEQKGADPLPHRPPPHIAVRYPERYLYSGPSVGPGAATTATTPTIPAERAARPPRRTFPFRKTPLVVRPRVWLTPMANA